MATLETRLKEKIIAVMDECSVEENSPETSKEQFADDLDFHNIALGLGSFDCKPKIGSACLIGMIDNNTTTSFLIMAEEVEEIDVNVKDCQLKINNGFLLKKQNETLKALMVDLLQEIQNMKFTTNTGSTIMLVNKPQFVAIENRFKDFLKDS